MWVQNVTEWVGFFLTHWFIRWKWWVWDWAHETAEGTISFKAVAQVPISPTPVTAPHFLLSMPIVECDFLRTKQQKRQNTSSVLPWLDLLCGHKVTKWAAFYTCSSKVWPWKTVVKVIHPVGVLSNWKPTFNLENFSAGVIGKWWVTCHPYLQGRLAAWSSEMGNSIAILTQALSRAQGPDRKPWFC
jgi:hypothetical protein